MSTIFHTPCGDIELPGTIPEQGHAKITKPEELKATYKSNIAPLWLVFPGHIFNTHNITAIIRLADSVQVNFNCDEYHRVPVTDTDKTWTALQKAFADGVSNE